MFTQCPECRIYFRITPAQLSARQGMVRCGQCAAVFKATERLLDKLPSTAKVLAKKDASAPTPPKRRARRVLRPTPEPETLSPEVVAPLLFSSAPRTNEKFSAVWITASVLFVLASLLQLTYLFRIELAEQPALRPLLADACAWIGCAVERRHNVNRIEFETSIAPHPKFSNALRLRADLVNRAERAQPLPVLEITLTDGTGKVLARRPFQPRDYLAGKSPSTTLAPNIVVHALLDITNPDNRAVGYEVRLLPGT